MIIKARFLCHEVAKGREYERVKLHAVYSSNPEAPNHTWSKATPTGSLEMQINNPAAFGAFVPGVEYDLTFAPVPVEPAPAS